MKKHIRMFFILLKFKLSKSMMYSFDFWSAFFADGMLFVVQLLTFSAIFSHTESINEWNMYQVVIFIGTFTVIDGLIMATCFFGVISLPSKIKSGDLDLYIVKPINTMFYVSFDSFNPASLLVSIFGFFIVAYGVVNLKIAITVPIVIGYLFLVVIMYILMYSLMLLLRVAAFWFIKINSLMNIENQVIEFAFRIPGIVYKGFMKFILWVIVPYGLIATIPTQFISDVLELKYWILSISVTLTFFILASYLFKKGLQRYSSASS